MARASASAEKVVDADPGTVYAILADYRTHHPRIMPPAYFSDLEVEEGGIGEGTVFHITLRLLGKRDRLHMRVSEPEPGRTLVETNLDTGVDTVFAVEPAPGGATRLRISSEWDAHGFRGLFDRLVATRLLRRILSKQLDELGRYLRSGEARETRSPHPTTT
jgi:hypothetical protein